MPLKAFVPVRAEQDQLKAWAQHSVQMGEEVTQARNTQRSQRLIARYQKYPWLSPGIATAFTKWEEAYGPKAAKNLSRAAYTILNAPDIDTDQKVADHLEAFVATTDFKRQVQKYREGRNDEGKDWFDDVVNTASDIPFVGTPVRAARSGVNAVGDVSRGEFRNAVDSVSDIPSAPIANAMGSTRVGGNAVERVPLVGPTIKGTARSVFTALETPLQEVQAGATNAVTGLIGPVGDQARNFKPGSEESMLGAASGAPDYSPTSSGAIALGDVLKGRRVDLGTGYFPGGEVEKEHARRVRQLGSFTYDGKSHYATPGRLIAAAVTEPGTDPFNIISGSVDAIATWKADPANILLAGVGAARTARKTFSATEEAVARAGGITSSIRNWVHGPTVAQWLDNPTEGGRLVNHIAERVNTYEDMLDLARRTKFAWPVEMYTGSLDAVTPEAVRPLFEKYLGTELGEIPSLFSMSANVRANMGQLRALHGVPGRHVELTASGLSGPNGGMKQLYEHMVGLGIDDDTVGHALYDIAKADTRPGRFAAFKTFLKVEQDAHVANGLPVDAARKLSGFADNLTEESRIWFDDRLSTGSFVPGTFIDGQGYPLSKPFLETEMLGPNVTLPALIDRKKAYAKYGRIFGIVGTGAGDELATRGAGAVENVGDALRPVRDLMSHSNAGLLNLQNKIWKPLVLLRGAWTLRVIGEEQVRMAATGLTSIFAHPITYITWMTSGKDSKIASNALEWAEQQNAIHRATQGAFGLDEGTTRFIGKNTKTWLPEDAGHSAQWADKLITYHQNPPMQAVARALTEEIPTTPLTRDAIPSALNDVKQRFFDGNLRKYREDLLADGTLSTHFNLAEREGADAYIDGLYARLHTYSGANTDIMSAVASGKYTPRISADQNLTGLRVTYDGEAGEIVRHNKGNGTAHILFDGEGEPLPLPIKDLQLTDDHARDILTLTDNNIAHDKAFINFLEAQDPAIKPAVSGMENVTARDSSWYKHITEHLFSALMDRPSAYLSRSPAFKQYYWNEVERLMPYADPKTQARFIAEASTARIPKKAQAAIRDASATSDARLTVDELDHVAKSHAVDNVRELLYDFHKRNRTLAALQLVSPFGEAWKEILGSYARIATQRPQTIRRFQVIVNGARGANPFDYVPGAIPDEMKGRGFFYKDPNNGGEETFTFPWSQDLTESVIGMQIPLTGNVQSLSLGFNLMPGVGPVGQFPAALFLNRYMDDKKFDPLRQFFQPYGEPDLQGGVLESLGLPSWMKKMWDAYRTNPRAGGQSARALNNTIMDVLAYGASSGEYDMHSPEGIQKATKDAERKGRQLYFLRGTFQFGAPAAGTPQFYANTKNDKRILMGTLRDELHKLYEKDADTAVAKFIDRFGEPALYSTGPKTLGTVIGQEYTQRGLDWERDHKDLAESYPATFALMSPPSRASDKRSYTIYLRAVTSGQRTAVDPKNRIEATNNVLGTMWYDRVRRRMGLATGDPGNKSQQLFLADTRSEIAKSYPGWRTGTIDQGRIPNAVQELQRASSDPNVAKANRNFQSALRSYFDARDGVLKIVRKQGGGGDMLRPGFATAAKWAPLRRVLSLTAEELGIDSPAFRVAWEDVLSREMTED